MVEHLPITVLKEIVTYLTPHETFILLPTLNHNFYSFLIEECFMCFWLKTYLGISLNLDSNALINIYVEFKANKILDFQAWKTTGGVSPREPKNSYENMWKYNPLAYSTDYKEDSSLPLSKNTYCLAKFCGDFQMNEFKKFFYIDLYKIACYPATVRREYSDFHRFNETRIFVLDPLSHTPYLTSQDYYADINFIETFNYTPRERANNFNNNSNDCIPIIKKIAVARPLFYTGRVKTLLFLFVRDAKFGEFENFEKFNDVESFEDAKGLAKMINYEVNEEYEFVEFEETKDMVYPALWIMFKTWKVNHLLIELKKCHYASCACVNMISIDDTRRIHQMEAMQPNFDIMYSLLIGSITSNSS